MQKSIEEVRDIFRKIHDIDLPHISGSPAFDQFADIWGSFLGDTTAGMFCKLVSQYGYPLDVNAVENSAYVRRPTVEAPLARAILEGKNVIVVGKEGLGKTTTVHYVVGHALFSRKTAAATRNLFIYINTIAYDSEPDEVSEHLYNSIFARLSQKTFDALRAPFEVEMSRLRKKSDYHRLYYSTAHKVDYVTNFLAYFSVREEHRYVYFIIDNVDSVATKGCQQIFHVIRTLNERIRRRAASYSDEIGRRVTRSAELKLALRFIIPVRPETWSFVGSPTLGLFPLENVVEFHFHRDLDAKTNIWRFVSDYLFIEKRDEIDRITKEIDFKVQVTGRIKYTPSDKKAFLAELVEWLRYTSRESDRQIKDFSGGSIRRMKMYGLKVLGHVSVARAYVASGDHSLGGTHPADQSRARTESELRILKPRARPESQRRLLREAIYDFSQPIGTVPWHGHFHLNPFHVVHDDARRSRNPLLGVQTLLYLQENWEGLSYDLPVAKCVKVQSLLEYLTTLSYERIAIQEMFHCFLVSGLLRPHKAAEIAIRGETPVYKEYVLDEVALERYCELVNFSGNRERSISFANSATRVNYGLGYSSAFRSILYDAFVNLMFLNDVIIREQSLKAKLRQKTVKIKVPSYAHLIYEPIMRKWGGVLNTKGLERLKRGESEMMHCATALQQRIAKQQGMVSQEYLN